MGIRAAEIPEYFMPKTPQDHLHPTVEHLVRVHVFVALACILTVISAVFSLCMVALHLLTDHVFMLGIVAGLLCALIGGSILVYFKKSGNFWGANMMLSTVFLLAILGSIAISGGYHSPLLPMITACPIIAAVTGGRHEGVYYTLISLLAVLMLLLVNSLDISWIDISTGTNNHVIHTTTWIITLIINAGCLFCYQYYHEQLGPRYATPPTR